jgi:hypothetical protein
VVVLLAFSQAVYESSFFPASLPTFVVGGFLDGSYSNMSEEKSCVVLIWISSMARMVNIFHVFFSHFDFFL